MIDIFRRFGHRAGGGSQPSNTPSVRLGLGRLEATHTRHEDIGDHQIERRVVGGGEPGTTAIGDRDPKAAPLEPSAKREGDMRIVINNQKAAHTGSSCRGPRVRFTLTLIAL
jgi:hypothetical protein